MREPTTERDVLLNLLAKLAGCREEVQLEVLAREVRAAPGLFRDVWDALRRVEARVGRDRVSPAVACERELRLIRGVDVA